MATNDDIGQSVNRAAWYHGLGRLSPQQVTDLILKDLGDLSSALGKHPYFLGDSAGEVDCGAFAMLSQMVWKMPGSPFEPGVKQYRNLVDFVLRMRDNFWPDWQTLLQVRGEEDVQEAGIFPGSEFLHKRQLNSDSSHWDSKGSSSVTLKGAPHSTPKRLAAEGGDAKNGNELTQDQKARASHVTFQEQLKEATNDPKNLQASPLLTAENQQNGGVQQIPQGILRSNFSTTSSNSSARTDAGLPQGIAPTFPNISQPRMNEQQQQQSFVNPIMAQILQQQQQLQQQQLQHQQHLQQQQQLQQLQHQQNIPQSNSGFIQSLQPQLHAPIARPYSNAALNYLPYGYPNAVQQQQPPPYGQYPSDFYLNAGYRPGSNGGFYPTHSLPGGFNTENDINSYPNPVSAHSIQDYGAAQGLQQQPSGPFQSEMRANTPGADYTQ